MPTPEFTQEQLEEWSSWWARRLLLLHWDVTYDITRLRETADGDAMGECRYAATKHVACISLLDPIDYDPKDHWRYDPEAVLVHELIHLHFAEFFEEDRESPKHKAMEKAIDALARSFVSLKREYEHAATTGQEP